MLQSLTASVNISSNDLGLDTTLSQAFPAGTWNVQLRSLNQRFFELTCSIPDFAIDVEIPIRKLLQKNLLRGRVEFRLSYFEQYHQSPVQEKLDHEIIRQELRKLYDLQCITKDFGMELPHPNSLELLKYCRELQASGNGRSNRFKDFQDKAKGLKGDKEDSRESEGYSGENGREEPLLAWQQAVLDFVAHACGRLVAIRHREGRELHQELVRLNEQFIEQCHLAQNLEKDIPIYYTDQLREKYQYFKNIYLDPVKEGDENNKNSIDTGILTEERLLSELSLFLAKGDIREELSRLYIHAKRFAEIIQQAAEASDSESSCCAKELDFLLQEMNREANTLGSKSPLIALQQIAVRLKVLIEQMREQVKNVL